MNNILVLTNSISGLFCFRKEVMKSLVENGWNVYISHPDQNSSSDYFVEIGCEDIITPLNRRGVNPVEDLALTYRYCKLLKSIRPQAVLTYTIKPNVYGGIACRLFGVPQLANVTGLGDSIENGGLLAKLTTCLYKISLSKARVVFFQNSANRDAFAKLGIVDDSSVLLPGSGVNLQYHAYQDYPPDGEIKFLFIGRLLKDKGVEEYFAMAKAIKEKYPNTEFRVLGHSEGTFHDELAELEKEGVVKYMGVTSDVRPFIRDVHCTIMPSYHEGLSNVNLESAACGRPVITTNVPGCKETVTDGVSGYLCESKNWHSLAESVERFIILPYESKKDMGLAARKKVEQFFDRKIVIDKYLNAVSNLKK